MNEIEIDITKRMALALNVAEKILKAKKLGKEPLTWLRYIFAHPLDQTRDYINLVFWVNGDPGNIKNVQCNYIKDNDPQNWDIMVLSHEATEKWGFKKNGSLIRYN